MMDVEFSKDKSIRWGDRENLIYVRWNRIRNCAQRQKMWSIEEKEVRYILNEVKPVENISKNLQSVLEMSPMQKEVFPSHKAWEHACEYFKVVLLSLISNGLNMSTPHWVNDGSSFFLSGGKLAIIFSATFPLNLWQVAHFKISLFLTEFTDVTQYLEDLISLSVIFLPLCAVFSWHHLIIKLVICSFIGNKIGCLTTSSGPDCLSRPPILSHLSRDSNIQYFLLTFLIDLHWGFCKLLEIIFLDNVGILWLLLFSDLQQSKHFHQLIFSSAFSQIS